MPYGEADVVVEVAASRQPFPPYPTEEQLLARPAADVDLGGVTARSHGDGMLVTWRGDNWEYTALGRPGRRRPGGRGNPPRPAG